MIDVISNKSNLFIPFGISVKGSSKTEFILIVQR